MHEMTNPLNASFSIRLFGNIINTAADNLFNDMLIHTGFLCRGDELNTTIMRTIHSSWMWRNHTIIRCFIKIINKEYLHVLILNQSAVITENDYTCGFQSTYTNCIRFLFAEHGWM